jgi:hypothetical protein
MKEIKNITVINTVPVYGSGSASQTVAVPTRSVPQHW